jgi:endonuclease/exonuclease/phosphatase (EEP) superfamily protein YafD
VVNVHAINFTLTTGAYREQMAAIGDVLATHRGPIVFGGDLNTWSEARMAIVQDLAARLDLTEIRLPDDRRALFLGKPADHLYVRDLEVTAAQAFPVTSSDHNPVAATLRYAPQPGATTVKRRRRCSMRARGR